MSRKESKPRVDIYAKITDRIVAELEKGVRPWVQAMECWEYDGSHHAAAAPQRTAVSGHQHAASLVGGGGAGVRLAHMDDVQAER
jgi:antirestriction protein ArdC